MDAFNAMDNPAADPFGGFLTSMGGGAPQATLQDALNAPAPQVNMPQRGQADTSKIAPLAMLALAASIAQRRQQGQSRTSQILDGALRAAQVAGSLKQEAEGQVDKRYAQDVNAMKTQQELQAGAINLETATRNNNMAKASAPMMFEELKMKMGRARTEAEVSAIELRLKKLREGSAQELLNNEIELGKATTDARRAEISQKADQARAQLRQADAALMQAQAQRDRVATEAKLIEDGKKQPKIQVGKGNPGEPVPISGTDPDGTIWTSYQAMLPAEAKLYLREQHKALEKSGMKVPPIDDYVNQNLDSYLKPKRSIVSGKGATGEQPGPGAAAPGAKVPAPESMAQEFSVKNPGKATRTSDGKYFFNGQPVSEEEAASKMNMTPEQLRSGRAKPAGPQAGPPNLAGTQPSAPTENPEATRLAALARKADLENAQLLRGERWTLSPDVVAYLKAKQVAAQAEQQQRNQQFRADETNRGRNVVQTGSPYGN